MKESARYAKIVFWSDEDQSFVGMAPGLFQGGCYARDEKLVFEELLQIVDEAIASAQASGKPLPKPTGGRVGAYASGVGRVAEE
jgi:hypothetical protein